MTIKIKTKITEEKLGINIIKDRIMRPLELRKEIIKRASAVRLS